MITVQEILASRVLCKYSRKGFKERVHVVVRWSIDEQPSNTELDAIRAEKLLVQQMTACGVQVLELEA